MDLFGFRLEETGHKEKSEEDTEDKLHAKEKKGREEEEKAEKNKHKKSKDKAEDKGRDEQQPQKPWGLERTSVELEAHFFSLSSMFFQPISLLYAKTLSVFKLGRSATSNPDCIKTWLPFVFRT